MTKRKRFGVSQALSRGLTETIHVVENSAGTYRNAVIPLSRIELDPENPRKLAVNFDDLSGVSKDDPLFSQKSEELEKLKELASTIESSGVINPIVVYKRGETYRVVAGERRCLASFIANKTDIEARVFTEKPKGFELKLVQWIENTAREDLSLTERIENIRDIITEYQNQHGETKISAVFLKNITGLSLPQASYYLAVLNAPTDVHEAVVNGQLRSLDKAAVIAGVSSETVRTEALSACIEGCSLKDLRKIISKEKAATKKTDHPKPSSKRGRATTRVNMGFTLNTEVVQTIVTAVLTQLDYRKYADIFSTVNWDHYEQSARAFKKLIEILEQEIITTR